VRSNGSPQWSEVEDHPPVLSGGLTSESSCLRERAGLDGKAQLSVVLKLPLKHRLGLGSAPPSLGSSPTAARRQQRPLERWSEAALVEVEGVAHPPHPPSHLLEATGCAVEWGKPQNGGRREVVPAPRVSDSPGIQGVYCRSRSGKDRGCQEVPCCLGLGWRSTNGSSVGGIGQEGT